MQPFAPAWPTPKIDRAFMFQAPVQSTQIASRCGLRDAAEFSLTFRRFAGRPPREYRLPFLKGEPPGRPVGKLKPSLS